MVEIDVQTKIYNIHHIVDDIREFPQTYSTILKEHKDNGTLNLILRRKLSNECKSENIYKMTIPGTRFGKIIFYSLPKKYHILVETNRMRGGVLFVFFEYKKINQYYIKVTEFWKLDEGRWKHFKEEKTIFDGNILIWL